MEDLGIDDVVKELRQTNKILLAILTVMKSWDKAVKETAKGEAR